MKRIDLSSRDLSTQAVRDIHAARKMREKAFAMREETLETRLRLWLKYLTRELSQTCGYVALEHALDAAISVASADFANIQLVHPIGRGLELKAQRGFSDSFVNYFEFVEDRNTACAVAFAERRPIVVPDVASSAVFAETEALAVVLEAGVRAVKSTPLVDRSGEILGVLSVHYRDCRIGMYSDVVRLQKLADGIAAMIDGQPAQLTRFQSGFVVR